MNIIREQYQKKEMREEKKRTISSGKHASILKTLNIFY